MKTNITLYPMDNKNKKQYLSELERLGIKSKSTLFYMNTLTTYILECYCSDSSDKNEVKTSIHIDSYNKEDNMSSFHVVVLRQLVGAVNDYLSFNIKIGTVNNQLIYHITGMIGREAITTGITDIQVIQAVRKGNTKNWLYRAELYDNKLAKLYTTPDTEKNGLKILEKKVCWYPLVKEDMDYLTQNEMIQILNSEKDQTTGVQLQKK